MDGKVVGISRDHVIKVMLENEVLLVLPKPAGVHLELGDRLRFAELAYDRPVVVDNLTARDCFEVSITAKDAHDLRLEAEHGRSRTPSTRRLAEL